MKNYDLDATNAELASEINDLNQKVIELRAMYIEDLRHKEKVESLIQIGILNENKKYMIKF